MKKKFLNLAVSIYTRCGNQSTFRQVVSAQGASPEKVVKDLQFQLLLAKYIAISELWKIIQSVSEKDGVVPACVKTEFLIQINEVEEISIEYFFTVGTVDELEGSINSKNIEKALWIKTAGILANNYTLR